MHSEHLFPHMLLGLTDSCHTLYDPAKAIIYRFYKYPQHSTQQKNHKANLMFFKTTLVKPVSRL